MRVKTLTGGPVAESSILAMESPPTMIIRPKNRRASTGWGWAPEPASPSGGLNQTVKLSEFLPVVQCVAGAEAEARFVHQNVFFGKVSGYGFATYGIELQPGATIVDVGSNIGSFAMWALVTLRGNARLIAVEPVPVLARCLEANVAQYSVRGLTKAKVLNVGCTSPDKAGPSRIDYLPGYTLLSSQHGWARREVEVMAAGLKRFTNKDDEAELLRLVETNLRPSASVPVQLAPLSELLAKEENLGQIDLLKIDAVKAEWDILMGITDADWARIRQVVVEVHLLGDRLEQVVALLRSKGFADVKKGYPCNPTFLAYKEYGMLKPTDAAYTSSPPSPRPSSGGGARGELGSWRSWRIAPAPAPATPPMLGSGGGSLRRGGWGASEDGGGGGGGGGGGVGSGGILSGGGILASLDSGGGGGGIGRHRLQVTASGAGTPGGGGSGAASPGGWGRSGSARSNGWCASEDGSGHGSGGGGGAVAAEGTSGGIGRHRVMPRASGNGGTVLFTGGDRPSTPMASAGPQRPSSPTLQGEHLLCAVYASR
ncbi:31-O-demethyl-FK506 methyltransferase FkbM [Tetrabaena socialis]|uniref:31-O-demethyl-FK506 methyltransferase FkbM n=1 Tax=Tetrabaena socialis TaxID=47790 RepID=A0A2J8AA05_9CHLO|nr:31-O-demethyl-FK506 methyltransferase FkbM [Tetrabaena socialis]|eukprot:PNH09341.1 31-O-demethyl-FK506 methyltransferase FkbM [Tetrabaena socialis]